jgi:Ca-activated chloride channel family protein
MKDFMQKNLSVLPFYAVVVLSAVWLIFFYDGPWNRLLITSDQEGYKLYQKKEYVKAAQSFEDSSFKGASFYRAGVSDKEGKYNLGNANVMLGLYDPAIEAYELALKIDPDFKEAKENLIVAKARKILKEPENDGEQGVGELGADEIVFDNKGGKGVDDDIF